jgi:glutamate--cysteine ligase
MSNGVLERMDAIDDTPLSGLDDLLGPFHDAEKPRERWRVGTEAEKFGVRVDTFEPLPYAGPRSVSSVLSLLVERDGWTAEREHEGGQIIALTREAAPGAQASITLEPGGQLELSGAPLTTVHQTCDEVHQHMKELAAMTEELGIAWLGLGFHPFATQAELPWVPKDRYAIMREYLPTRGRYAVDMMRRTATVQANFDYSSEADAMRKLRASLRVSVIGTAIFANSPFVEGRATGERSHRARVWLEVDPDRSGLLPFLWSDAASYRDYVEWALDVPMFLVKRGKTILRNTGQTFRSFMKDGYSGARATRGDWATHLNTLFPEVRLKRTLEIRGADSQQIRLVCALPALWKGLLYDETALAELERFAAPIDYESAQAVRESIADRGVGAELLGRPLADWGRELVEIAWRGLARIDHKNSRGKDETIHLEHLKALLRDGKTPADDLLERIDGAPDFRAAVLANARA